MCVFECMSICICMWVNVYIYVYVFVIFPACFLSRGHKVAAAGLCMRSSFQSHRDEKGIRRYLFMSAVNLAKTS